MSKLESWFGEFISRLRKEADRLSEEEKAKISNLDDFFPPCQVTCVEYNGFSKQ